MSLVFFFSSRRRHTRGGRDWSSDVCSSDLEPARQPHHFNVAPSLSLKPSAGLDTIEIPVNVELQQHRWMIRRPTGCLGRDPVKSQLGQIESINKDVNHLNGIILVDPIC